MGGQEEDRQRRRPAGSARSLIPPNRQRRGYFPAMRIEHASSGLVTSVSPTRRSMLLRAAHVAAEVPRGA